MHARRFNSSEAAYLQTQRLPDHVPIGQPRFVGRKREERLVATFALWNVLDRVMATHSKSKRRWATYARCRCGACSSSSPTLASCVYCEIGMNGGHSAAAMLIGNPHVVVHSFDLYEHEYAVPTASFLNLTFGDRFVSHLGNSRTSVPAWVAENNNRCDMLLVDGDHSAKGAMLDLINLRPAAAEGARVVVTMSPRSMASRAAHCRH